MLLPTAAEEDITQVFCKCSGFISLPHEPVGRWFEACLKRQRSEKFVSVVTDEEDTENDSDDDDDKELTEDEKTFLLSLDAAEWKKQDHYRVLGLSHLRSAATDEDVKKAYRKKVLRHHPDKKSKHRHAPLPAGVNEHGYFTCITYAYETLSSKTGRQAYDSVDHTFDGIIPNYSQNSKQDFFKVFEPVFSRNARWSKIKPVPLLGDSTTSLEDVNAFYAFWYDFSSWREFSYLDEEDKDKAENREERRWMDRENRHMQQKRKKDEIQRIRSLVDNAFQYDPRLKKYKEEQKQIKLEKKKQKKLAAQEKEKERLLVLENEKKLKEKADQEAKEKAQKEKKEKDKLKKTATRDRKIIRQAIKTEHFFNIDADEVAALERLEKSLQNLSTQSLQELREVAESQNKSNFKDTYIKYSTEILEKLKKQQEEKRKQEEIAVAAAAKQPTPFQFASDQAWTELEVQLLVKATTLFPIGTVSRWDVIAAYINEHSGAPKPKNGKQVISKVKNLKKLDSSAKDEVNKMAFKNLEKATNAKLSNHITADPSKNDSLASPTNDTIDTPWSSDEQKLLEQALKTYGAKEPERWEKIASIVPSRTKKECIKRCKELVEMVKAKKAAQAAAAR